MPFPLAHPAAVLPFKRFCPRLLSFPALIVGSLSPDAGYFFRRYHWEDFSHQLVGSIGFCLPVGLIVVLVLYGVGSRMVSILPHPFRRMLTPIFERPRASPLAVVFSVLLGAWMHILWDSFTHREGWLVQHISLLQLPVVEVGSHKIRICHLLWYASTVTGVAWIFMAYQQWLQSTLDSPPPTSFRARYRTALLVGALMLPIGVAHHLVRHPAADLALVIVSAVFVMGFASWVGRQRKDGAAAVEQNRKPGRRGILSA